MQVAHTPTTSRRALLATAAAVPVGAVALPVAVASGADPSLAAFEAWRATENAINTCGLADDDPAFAALLEAERVAERHWLRTPANSPVGVLRRVQQHLRNHCRLDRAGRFIPSGYSTDDRMALAILRDLSALAGEPAPKVTRPPRIEAPKPDYATHRPTAAPVDHMTEAEREEMRGLFARVHAILDAATARAGAA